MKKSRVSYPAQLRRACPPNAPTEERGFFPPALSLFQQAFLP